MKNQLSNMKKWRFALVAGIVAGLLTPIAAPSGSVNAAGASQTTTKYYTAGGTTSVQGIAASGWEGKTIYAAITTDQPSTATVAVTKTTGLTLPFGYAAYSGGQIAFVGTQEAVNAALATLTLTTPASTTSSALKIQTTFFLQSDGLAYNPQNQHFYRFIDGNISGTNAFAAAAGQVIFGLTGYLASITTAAENDFVSSKIEGAKNVWIGATDVAKEGEWKWTGGPDDAKQFWSGNCTAVDGKVADGYFAKWATGEPNNWITATNFCGGTAYDVNSAQLGEDCVVTNWQSTTALASEKVGFWNDMPCTFVRSWDGTAIGGYVVEFGTKTTGSTYDSNVDIQDHTLVKYVPTQKLQPSLGSFVWGLFNFVKKAMPKSFKISFKKKATKTKPAQTFTCPAMRVTRFSYTLLFQEAGRYSFYFTSPSGKRIPMQCGTKIKTRMITEPISAPVIQSVKEGERPVITAYLKRADVGGTMDYPMLNVILKRPDGTLVRIDQPNPPLPGTPIK